MEAKKNLLTYAGLKKLEDELRKNSQDWNKPENVDAYAETTKPVLFLPFPSEIPVIFPLYLHHKAFPEFLFE